MVSNAQKYKKKNLSKFNMKLKKEEIKIEENNSCDNSFCGISSKSASLKCSSPTNPPFPQTLKQKSIDLLVSSRKGNYLYTYIHK